MTKYIKALCVLLTLALLLPLSVTLPPLDTEAVSNPNNIGLVDFASKALNEKWGYFYGSFGQTATQSLLDSKAKQYPSVYYSELYNGKTVYENAKKWLGGRVVDCIGLMKAYIWWDNAKNGPVYQSSTDKGATSTYNEATKKGDISTIPETHGVLVWKKGHIGVYIGNGKVIEARGTAYGVVMTNLHERSWTNWCYYKNMSYKTDTNGLYKINGATYQYVNKQYKKGWYNNRYFGQDGKMRTGTKTIDGVTFTFASNGLLTSNPNEKVICVNKSLDYIRIGKSLQLNVSCNKSSPSVTWSSSDKSVATVSSAGLVKGLKEGKTVITATEAGGHTSKCTIYVQNIYRIISAKASNATPKPGEQVKFTVVTGINDEEMNVYIDGTFYKKYYSPFTRSTSKNTWTIPLSFKTAGKHTVKFVAGTDDIPSNAKSVTIKVSTLSMDKTMTLSTGDSKQLKVSSDTPIVSYISSDTAVASVDGEGVVTALKPGSCTVTVENEAGLTGKVIIIIDNQYVSLRIGYKRAIQNDIKTTIDNLGSMPYLSNSRTMIPIRFINEKMGASVKWISNDQPITVTYNDITIAFTINSKTISVTNSEGTTEITLDCAPQFKNRRVYIPVRAISQSLGFQVQYNSSTKVIVVSNPRMCSELLDYRFSAGASYITV